MFQAAQVALEAEGFVRLEWSHRGVHSVFNQQLIHQKKLYPRVFLSYLTFALTVRQASDYGEPGTSLKIARRQVRRAGILLKQLRRYLVVEREAKTDQSRELLDQRLTELALMAKKLCPQATVEVNTVRYEDEDGRVKVFPPANLPEAEEEKIEEALGEKCAEILEQDGFFILCAVFDAQP